VIDPFLTEALSRLDSWLSEVCDREDARARKLSRDGATGWAAVQAMAGASVDELAFAGPPPPDLLPPGDHALTRVQRAFGLAPVEAEVLLLAITLHLEPRYRGLYAVLQDNLQQGWVTERLLLTILGRSPERHRVLIESLSDAGRLVATGLVQAPPGVFAPMERPLDLAPEVRGALLGLSPPEALAGVPLGRAPRRRPPTDEEGPAFAVIFGAGAYRDEAEALGGSGAAAGVLALDAADDRATVIAAGRAAWRLGALQGALPIVDLTGLEAGADASVASELRRRVLSLGGRIFVRSRRPLPLAAPQREAVLPAYRERLVAWNSAALARGAPLDDGALDRLASTFRLGAPLVEEAYGAVAEPTEAALREAASRLCRVPIRHAVEVPTARTFADLVVRDTTKSALDRLVHYAENRDRLAEARGLEGRFRLRRGPLVLFAGRSGTGKTLAAEVISGALGRPLYVVDLSRLVSKYIGETEKHIEEVLSEGERAGVVLFFDEADALFSTRTEVSTSNDRYANLEVGFLLQRIERHDGLVILATNLRHAVDDAFLRRFQFRIEFPFPEPHERHAIWDRMIPPGVPRAPDLDLESIARTHRLAGGDISNAALKAIFLAEQRGVPLGQSEVERAVALELYELGRLSRRELRSHDADADRGELLRGFVEALETLLEEHLRRRFAKEIHVVHGAPTKEALAGKRPAVSVALYRMAAPRSAALRVGFVISVWSARAEEEHELLGVTHEALTSRSIAPVFGQKTVMRVQESYDFDLLYRFWSSHGHPVRASIVVEGEVG
jgi:AAA+ superfamily predicted ATPase